MSIALLVLTVALVPAAWNFRKTYARWNKLLERTSGDLKPLLHHAAIAADNVDYITTALRADVHRVNETVADANERLQAAVQQMERRVQAFSALLDVAQQESERAFVATASTVRVRGGKTVVTDGPFAETREQLGGFYLIHADSLDEALAVAARIPGARTGGVEVRPVLEIPMP